MIPTREKIIKASLELFAKKGFEATSIRDIAQEAGINSSTLYYYINNKEDFLTSIIKMELERNILNMNEVISSLETAEQRLASIVQLHVISHGVNKLTTLVSDTEFRALHGQNKEIIRKLRKKYELIWLDTIEAGKKEGKFTSVKNSKLTTFAALAMCTGVVHWYSRKGELSLFEISKIFANMVFNLLGAEKNGKKIHVEDIKLPNLTSYYPLEGHDYSYYLEALKK